MDFHHLVNTKINYFFNKKIDELKSITKKMNGKETSKQIRKLLIKRENIINYYINVLAKWFVTEYKNKELIINTNTSQQYNGFFCFQTFMKLINFDFICDDIILNFKNDYPLIITYSSSFAELTASLNNLEN